MRHVPEGTLRRLIDEPFAVPDREAEHLASCRRCQLARERVAGDAAAVAGALARPFAAPDVDDAWHRLEASASSPAPSPSALETFRPPARRRWRDVAPPVPRAAVLVTVAVLLVAATAGLTAALVPSSGKAPTTSSADIDALADFTGIDGHGVLGFGTASGTRHLPFGALHWSSQGTVYPVSSIHAAEQATGLHVPVPTTLPSGVGSMSKILVQPPVTATMTFNASAGSGLSGRSFSVTAGPAVLVEYGGSTTDLSLPTLATFVMGSPSLSPSTSSASKTSASKAVAFLLSKPGIPLGFAQELRLAGHVGTVLPLPLPGGGRMSQVDIDGTSGILATDPSLGVSGAIWQDHGGIVHAAVGLLDGKDILSVADQLG